MYGKVPIDPLRDEDVARSSGQAATSGIAAMGTLVNLRTARKRAAREQAADRAAENRIVHGRPKAERDLQDARSAKSAREHDAHRLDTRDEQ
jgi:hypothetical protein